MVRQLPIVQIEGKEFFVDERLKEYRQTNDPHNRITFDQLGNRKPILVSEKEDMPLQKKRQRNHKGKRL
jgi:hypothetical protein